MYRVTVYDKFGAVLFLDIFSSWIGAIVWMFDHRTNDYGRTVNGTVLVAETWELDQL
jgi:hypothetical protein